MNTANESLVQPDEAWINGVQVDPRTRLPLSTETVQVTPNESSTQSRRLRTTSDDWNVAVHRADIDWAEMPDWVASKDVDRAPVDLGDIVRVVVGPNIASQINQVGGTGNDMPKGTLLPAVVVRRYPGLLMNLKLFTDGARDVWLTSTPYYPVLLQHPDPEGNGSMSLLHARGDTWHLPGDQIVMVDAPPFGATTIDENPFAVALETLGGLDWSPDARATKELERWRNRYENQYEARLNRG